MAFAYAFPPTPTTAAARNGASCCARGASAHAALAPKATQASSVMTPSWLRSALSSSENDSVVGTNSGTYASGDTPVPHAPGDCAD